MHRIYEYPYDSLNEGRRYYGTGKTLPVFKEYIAVSTTADFTPYFSDRDRVLWRKEFGVKLI